MASEDKDNRTDVQHDVTDETSSDKISSDEEGIDKEDIDVSKDLSVDPDSREEEIRNIGIIQHLVKIGEGLQGLYETEQEVSEEESTAIYSAYLKVLNEDIEMINEQKKGYEEELPPNVLNITRPIDENMLKVMNSCLGVIYDYIAFIEEERELDLILNGYDILEQTSALLDETEEMLRDIFESVETTGGIIGEA